MAAQDLLARMVQMEITLFHQSHIFQVGIPESWQLAYVEPGMYGIWRYQNNVDTFLFGLATVKIVSNLYRRPL